MQSTTWSEASSSLVKHIGQQALDRSDPLVGLEVVREGDVDEHGALDLRQYRANEARLVATAEIPDRFARERRDVTLERAGRQPDAEAINRSVCLVLLVRADPAGRVSA